MSFPLKDCGSSSRVVQLSARANVGEGDWLLQTARWVTRTNKDEPARKSLFKDIKALSARATEEVGAADPVGDADGPSKANKRLVFALAYAKCSAAAKVNEDARKAMGALVDKVRGKTDVGIQGSGQNRKISYKNLQISVIKGPKHPEMSVSFSGGMDNAETADDQFEEFVGILHGAGGALGGEDERRTVNLGDTAIGLPVEHPFTGGMRFKILEPSGAGGERTVVLDSECMDALDTVLSGEVADDDGFAQMQQLFRPKWNAYTQYKSAFEEAGEGTARHRETERSAAFAPNELTRLIEFLQQRLKMNISPNATIFSATPGFSAAPEPHEGITAKDAEIAAKDAKIAELERRLAEFERQRAEEEARKKIVYTAQRVDVLKAVKPDFGRDDSATKARLADLRERLSKKTPS